jgi:hypothetical protein
MSDKWFNLVVPGIFNCVNNPKSWIYKAQEWLYEGGYGLSGGFDYFADVFGASAVLDEWADKLADKLGRWQDLGWSYAAWGHSNGCRLILRALERDPSLRVTEVNLFAPACNDNCDESGGDHNVNGLNAAAERGQIGALNLFVSPDDEILPIPGLSYGRLGVGALVQTSAAPCRKRNWQRCTRWLPRIACACMRSP